MENFLSPAIIAALTALAVSLITLFQFFKNQRLQQEQFIKNQNRGLTNKLYDLRIEHYPKAFQITKNVYRKKGNKYLELDLKTAREELIEWKSGTVDLILSVEASDSFYKLRDILNKNPANAGNYSTEQVVKIHDLTKQFRKQLRRDLGFMFREEKEKRRTKTSR